VSAFEAKRKSEDIAELEGGYGLIPIPPLFYKNVKKGGDGYQLFKDLFTH